MKITLKDALKQLQASHDALEALSDRHGCNLAEARVMCESEAMLKSPEAKAALAPKAAHKGGNVYAFH